MQEEEEKEDVQVKQKHHSLKKKNNKKMRNFNSKSIDFYYEPLYCNHSDKTIPLTVIRSLYIKKLKKK